MDNQVTPRAIAYATVQVGSLSDYEVLVLLIQNQLIFALSDADNWVQEHGGYKFPALYNFIIDFFEAPDLGPKTKGRNKTLLAWWNRWVPTQSSNWHV